MMNTFYVLVVYTLFCQRSIYFPNMNDGDIFYHQLRNEWIETANLIDKA